MSFPPRVQDLPKFARLEAGQRGRPLVSLLLSMTFLHCWKHPLDPTATSSQLNRNTFGNIRGFINIPCCPEITTPLLVGDIFFKIDERSMILLWKGVKCFCCDVSKRFRTLPADFGHPRPISNFLSFQKSTFSVVYFWSNSAYYRRFW